MKLFLSRLLDSIVRTERAVLISGMILLTVLILADTLGREIFSKGLFGANIYATHALIAVAMAGFGLATSLGQHLRPTVLDSLVPEDLESAAIRVGHLISAIISLVITFAAIRFVADTYAYHERNLVTGLPLWPVQVFLPLGFALNTLRHTIFFAVPGLAPSKTGGSE